MTIFKRAAVWFSPVAAGEAERQRREERNCRAMTGQVGDTSAADATGFPAPIAADEIDLACSVLEEAQEDPFVRGFPTRADVQEFRAALHRRMGAAAAVHAAPEFCPILAGEIEILARAVHSLGISPRTDARDAVGEGQRLLDDLHQRQGHAEAIQHLGSQPVFLPGNGKAATA